MDGERDRLESPPTKLATRRELEERIVDALSQLAIEEIEQLVLEIEALLKP